MDKTIQLRNKKITILHTKGKTQQYIATKFNLSRQRVQQIERSLGLHRDKPRGNTTYKLKCQYSGEIFETRNKAQKYAIREYYYLARRKSRSKDEQEEFIKERRERLRLKASWYYHVVFKKKDDWQDIIKARNQKYAPHAPNK